MEIFQNSGCFRIQCGVQPGVRCSLVRAERKQTVRELIFQLILIWEGLQVPLKTTDDREQLGKVTLVEWKDQRDNQFGENSLKSEHNR